MDAISNLIVASQCVLEFQERTHLFAQAMVNVLQSIHVYVMRAFLELIVATIIPRKNIPTATNIPTSLY